jgi:hypothetical protein
MAPEELLPPEPENGGSIAETPISPVYLLGVMLVVDMIC